MAEILEIALFKADVQPIRGREVFWLLSKSQVEHIVREVEVSPIPFAPRYLTGLAVWHGHMIPLVSLEKYFNFRTVSGHEPRKSVLVRTAVAGTGTGLARLLLAVPHDVRIRVLDSECSPAGVSQRDLDLRGLKGVYTWENDKLLLVPDLARIAAGGARQHS